LNGLFIILPHPPPLLLKPGWPYNYLFVAQQLGLVDGKIAVGTVLTRDQLFAILYNAMDLAPMTFSVRYIYNLDGTKDVYTVKVSQETTLAELADAKDAEAAVPGDSYVTSYAIISNKAHFDNVTYGAAKVAQYYGQNCIVLRRAATQGQGTILAVLGLASTTLTGELTYAAVKEGDKAGNLTAATFAGIQISNGALATSKTTTIQDPVKEMFLYNGSPCAVTFELMAAADELSLEVEYGEDGSIVKIFGADLWLTTEDRVVKTTYAAANINDNVASQWAVMLNKHRLASTSVAGVCTIDAVVIGDVDKLADIKQYDVLNLYLTTDGAVTKIEVTRDIVTGTFDKYYTTNAKKTYYVFDGKDYLKADACESDGHTVAIGSTAALSLDRDGDIRYIVNVDWVKDPAPTVVTGYALIKKLTSSAKYELRDNKITLAAMSNSIVLLGVDGVEATYENITTTAAKATDSSMYQLSNYLGCGDLYSSFIYGWSTDTQHASDYADRSFKSGTAADRLPIAAETTVEAFIVAKESKIDDIAHRGYENRLYINAEDANLIAAWCEQNEVEDFYGQLVEYKTVNGKLVSLSAVQKTIDYQNMYATAPSVMTLGATSLRYLDTDNVTVAVPYASKLVVISCAAAGNFDCSAAAVKDLAWLDTLTDVTVELVIKNNFVVAVIVRSATEVEEVATVSKFAISFVGKDTKNVVKVFAGKDTTIDTTKEYKFTSDSATLQVTPGQIYVNAPMAGDVVTLQAAGERYDLCLHNNQSECLASNGSVKNYTFTNDNGYTVVTTTGGINAKVENTAEMWIYDAKTATYTVFSGSIVDALKAVTKSGGYVKLFDLDNDGFVDFVVIFPEGAPAAVDCERSAT